MNWVLIFLVSGRENIVLEAGVCYSCSGYFLMQFKLGFLSPIG